MENNFDSISFDDLNKLHKEKTKSKYDLSNPLVSDSIGDLTFLFQALVCNITDKGQQRLDPVQFLHLLSQVSAVIRRTFDKMLKETVTSKDNDDMKAMKVSLLSTNLSHIRIAENIIDDMLEFHTKSLGGGSDTYPNYRTVQSVGVNVAPHEYKDWLDNEFSKKTNL